MIDGPLRGEVWWADLEAPRGSQPGYRRPVVIVTADDVNLSRIDTVVAVAVTSNLRLAAAPGTVFVTRESSGLLGDGLINPSQIVTLDKGLLLERAGSLPPATVRQLEEGLRLMLAL